MPEVTPSLEDLQPHDFASAFAVFPAFCKEERVFIGLTIVPRCIKATVINTGLADNYVIDNIVDALAPCPLNRKTTYLSRAVCRQHYP